LDKIKRGQDIQDAGLKKQAETIGGIQGENAAYGVTGGTNPNSPLSKEADAARQEIDKLPVVQKLKQQILQSHKWHHLQVLILLLLIFLLQHYLLAV
jgi:hypothetical protein